MSDLATTPQPADDTDLVAGGRLRRRVPTERQLRDAPDTSEREDRPAAVVAVGAESEAGPGWRGYLRDLDPRSIPASKLPLVVFMTLTALGSWGSTALGLAQPNIQADFGLSVTGLVTLASVFSVTSQVLGVPLGYLVDRVNRVWLVRIGAIGNALGGILFAFAGSVGGLVGANAFQVATTDAAGPAQTPLLADYYPSSARARVISLIGVAGLVGGLIAAPVAGYLIDVYGWRAATLGLGLVSAVVALVTLLLREPVRGEMDRLEMGVDPEHAAIAQQPPSFTEALRGGWSIRTLRLLAVGGMVTTIAAIPLNIVITKILAAKFLLSAGQRGGLASVSQILLIPALLAGAVFADRLLALRPRSLMVLIGGLSVLSAAALTVQALASNLVEFYVPSILTSILAGLVAPATFTVMTLVVPARYRGLGLQIAAPFTLIGTILGGVAIRFADTNRPQDSLLFFVPFLLIGAALQLACAGTVGRDIRAAKAAAVAREESDRSRLEGQHSKILVCRDVDVSYDDVLIVSSVDLDVREGEILALVGTNGAGKSTLLRAICGLTQCSNGAVFYDGKDITAAPTHENARRGISYVPGGQGVFPALTVTENLRTAARMLADAERAAAIESVLDMFPQLRDRLGALAGSLSGGEQQMLCLAQAFLGRPRLLLIDELSLGLAPAVIETLITSIRAIAATGVSVVLVEQSLNVALTVAERAVFMDKGTIAFDGPTEELLSRPDLVRAVFMGGGGATARPVARPRRATSRADDVEVALEAVDLCVSFGGVHALDHVSVDAKAGEVVGLIGPNGAGKTTLFDLLSGYIRPDSGTVVLGGRDITGLTPDARARAGLGRAFQSARLFGPLTVRETIAVAMERRAAKNPVLAAVWAPPILRSERKLTSRVDGYIELLGLGAYEDKFIRELSTGTRRAVEVACQMAAEPRVLLLDEPSSGLAQAETEALGPTLTRVVRETGCALLVIEHDLPLITRIADRLVGMELGRVLVTGPPPDVLSDERILRSYLSASPEIIERSGSRMASVLSTITTQQPQPPGKAPS